MDLYCHFIFGLLGFLLLCFQISNAFKKYMFNHFTEHFGYGKVLECLVYHNAQNRYSLRHRELFHSYFKETIPDFNIYYLSHLSMYLPLIRACGITAGKEASFSVFIFLSYRARLCLQQKVHKWMISWPYSFLCFHKNVPLMEYLHCNKLLAFLPH